MRRLPCPPCRAVAATFVLCSTQVAAAAPGFTLDPPRAGIYGGAPVAACAWPTTVSLAGSCSGTLVHPELVVYAAHCGDQFGAIDFGETVDDADGRTAATEFCRTYPGGATGIGTDFAFCKLAEAQDDIAIVPILMGCETAVLEPGQEVTIVGFGLADNGPYGIKRAVTTTINAVGEEAFIGGNGRDSCSGDSGGPVFVQVVDPVSEEVGWRVFGITSYGGECGAGGYYSLMHNGVGWLESESGLDLTPCHDADGTWAPGPGCTGFPLDPTLGGGSWGDGCDPGPLGGASATCGPSIAPPDDDPPEVVIEAPVAGEIIVAEGTAVVAVEVIADDGDGAGIEQVDLRVDMQAQPPDPTPPYAFTLALEAGTHVLVATAVDVAGNVGMSAEIVIEVEPPMAGASDSGGVADATTAGGTDATGVPAQDRDAAGCGCGAGVHRSAWLLAPLVAFARRRRRGGAREGSR